MLDTKGIYMLAMMCDEYVDANRKNSNHLIEVIEVLGIENHVSKRICCTNNDEAHLDMKR